MGVNNGWGHENFYVWACVHRSYLTTPITMKKPNQTFFAPCPRGLETILRAELEPVGAQNVTELPGGVSWQRQGAVRRGAQGQRLGRLDHPRVSTA